MAQGNNPGDGKTNPFGNGKGGSAGGNVAGRNFITNPGGNPGTRPRDFLASNRQQSKASDQGKDIAGAVPGARTAAEQANKTQDAGNPVGVGSIGVGAKPFKLGGV